MIFKIKFAIRLRNMMPPAEYGEKSSFKIIVIGEPARCAREYKFQMKNY